MYYLLNINILCAILSILIMQEICPQVLAESEGVIIALSREAEKTKDIQGLRHRAEERETEAQMQLAICYYHGNGIPQDYEEAFQWALRAAIQGNDEAEDFVGMCYLQGKGVEKLPTEGVKWLLKAAYQGNAESQTTLGIIYEFGEEGVPQDMNKAGHLYVQAAKQGNTQARCMLGRYILLRQGEPWHTKKGKFAINLIEQAANEGDPIAYEMIGFMYYWGIMGKKEDHAEAAKWLENGLKCAKFLLAMMYWNGDGVKQDRSKALELMSEAATTYHMADKIYNDMLFFNKQRTQDSKQ